MTLTSRDLQPTQQALFDSRLPLPQWHDLGATTQAEVIVLLAKLLVRIQASPSIHRGDPNE